MKKGACPKCGGENIYHCRVPKNSGGINPSEDCHYMFLHDVYTWQLTVEWETYLCVDCGYFENYCLDRALMAKVTGNPQNLVWKKVSPEQY
jgi:hypothetical protein